MKMPTGDPKVPDYIKRAKEIHCDFIERTDGSVGAPNDGDDNDDGNLNVDEEVEDDDDDKLTNYFDAATAEQFYPPSVSGTTNVENIPTLATQ